MMPFVSKCIVKSGQYAVASCSMNIHLTFLTFNTLIHLATWISSTAKTCLCFYFISVC